jgi:hypothetical protein
MRNEYKILVQPPNGRDHIDLGIDTRIIIKLI